jgi:ElaB/YqjD/DUF883 family membrane-anchored ribosome-binding protein
MMNELVNEYYSKLASANQATGEDAAIAAHTPYFLKVAEANNIDVNALAQDEAAFASVWNETVKMASEEEEESDEEKAKREHAEKKASVEKLAQWDMQGRVMAQSFLDELNKVAAPEQLELPGVKEKGRLGKLVERGKDLAGKTKDLIKKHPYAAGGIAAGTAALGGGAAYLATRNRKKKASAFEVEAAKLASAYLINANYDESQVVDALNGVLSAGGPASENQLKIASADYENALIIRAHEYVESVGVPVDWSRV